MGSRTVRGRIKVYVAGVATLTVAVTAAGFVRDGAEASATVPHAVSRGAESVGAERAVEDAGMVVVAAERQLADARAGLAQAEKVPGDTLLVGAARTTTRGTTVQVRRAVAAQAVPAPSRN